MSKSLDNHIEIAATPDETNRRVMMMVTDPKRQRRTDPGDPGVCNVFSFHKIYSSAQEVELINIECRRAGMGCVDCKRMMANNLNANLQPLRARRIELEKNPHAVWDILQDGGKRARKIAEKTIQEVREAIGLP
jgi:tryptophanyl-tRNA synthetase